MASAVPYNPDDFENNNPFAEPVNEQDYSEPIANDLPENHEEQAEEQYEEQADNQDIQNDHQSNQNDQSNPQPASDNSNQDPVPDKGTISETELRRLLPERFTKKYLLSIKLNAIEKNKAGNPILRFDAVVKGLPKFRQSKYKDVRRTYNEIVKFNKYLTISNVEVFVPVIPSAYTSYPTGGEDETKQLMNVWQEWFNRISHNPILVRDDEFIYFIENDFGYSVINSNRKTSVASGLLRKTLKQLAVPYDPYEELADFRPLIKAAYLTCQKLHKLLDKNSKSQKQLSIHVFDFCNKLGVMSQFETSHPGMRNMWEKLNKISQIQSDLILIESINEMGSLGDGIQSLVDDFYQVKEAMTNRYLIMRELIQAQAQTQAKHAQASKIKSKSSLDPMKVDEAIRSLEYATKAEESLNLQVKRISGEMNFERDEVIDCTEKKFKKMLKTFTLNKVDHHRRILKHLETIRLDIRSVDEKGGLSRLNRDNLTSLKHNLVQSQSANGDAWSSRTFRSLKKQEEDEENDTDEGKNTNLVNDDDRNRVDAKNAASILGVATF